MNTLTFTNPAYLFNEMDNWFLYGFFGTTLWLEVISCLKNNDFDKVISILITYFSQNTEREFSQPEINNLFREIHRLAKNSKRDFPNFIKALISSLPSNTQKLKQSNRTTFINNIIALRIYFLVSNYKNFSWSDLLNQLNEVNV